jgi:hypothetical protein
MAKQTATDTVPVSATDKKRMASIMANHRDDFLNHIEEVKYKISTGSLLFDRKINWGFGPGIVRFVGSYESGKTSAALNCMGDFLNNAKLPFRRKAVFFRSEGRLDDEIKNGCDFKFTKNPEEWEDGMCLEMLVNKFEPVFDTIKDLIIGNQENIKYFIVIDSMDMLISKGDAEKGFEDSTKVAGGAVITSNMLKQLALDIKVRGHFFIAISQVRADIRLQYSSAPVKDNFSGGNALLHAADWICEFHSVSKSSRFLEDPSAKPHEEKNPYVGHPAKVTLHKSTNRKTDTTFEFPIKYEPKKGVIWTAREVVPLMLGVLECLDKNKAWYYLKEEFVEALKEEGVNPPEKFQGEESLITFIEEHPTVVDLVKTRLALLS